VHRLPPRGLASHRDAINHNLGAASLRDDLADDSKEGAIMSHRGRLVAIFIMCAIVTVVFVAIAVSAHPAHCQGLSCPSGGGAASTGSGTSAWAMVGDIGSAVGGAGALVSGIQPLRKRAASDKAH
jgi:hypothetical protein